MEEVGEEEVILMMSDLFICSPVDEARLDSLVGVLKGLNVACLNFEKSFDSSDRPTSVPGFKCRRHGASYEVSIMCGL